MQVYLVGGAIRDQLLGLPILERDWVVVGATPEDLTQQGYKPVGKDFPVFLHPTTHEQYALARTEKKVAKGYYGFQINANPAVTLQDDLMRRDITINAMAQDTDGQIIDPLDGQKDLERRVIRHVSPAFVEDPVRILRVARFAATFGTFTVAPETIRLMQDMVQNGEVDALIPERVWQELQQALAAPYPWRFVEVLQACHALAVIFPEIHALYGVPNPVKWHPEIDSGVHTMLALKRITEFTPDPAVRFAVLLHDVGKAKTPADEWPKHHGHAAQGVPIVKQFCQRLHAPRKYRDLATLVTRYHSLFHDMLTLQPKAILKILMALDPFRKPERFQGFLLACQADTQGRFGCETTHCPQTHLLSEAYRVCATLNKAEIIQNRGSLTIEQALYNARLQQIQALQQTTRKSS